MERYSNTSKNGVFINVNTLYLTQDMLPVNFCQKLREQSSCQMSNILKFAAFEGKNHFLCIVNL